MAKKVDKTKDWELPEHKFYMPFDKGNDYAFIRIMIVKGITTQHILHLFMFPIGLRITIRGFSIELELNMFEMHFKIGGGYVSTTTT